MGWSHLEGAIMKETTLCYIEKDDKYLMLHRTKKENDYNHDKWIGVGGKFEPGEDAVACLLREVKEETGLTLRKYDYRGIVYFESDVWQGEAMHLFTATEFEGELMPSAEVERLVWLDYNDLDKISPVDRLIFEDLHQKGLIN